MKLNMILTSKPSTAEYSGWIYGIAVPGSKVLKIGMTKRLGKRLREWKRCRGGYHLVGAIRTKYCRKLGNCPSRHSDTAVQRSAERFAHVKFHRRRLRKYCSRCIKKHQELFGFEKGAERAWREEIKPELDAANGLLYKIHG